MRTFRALVARIRAYLIVRRYMRMGPRDVYALLSGSFSTWMEQVAIGQSAVLQIAPSNPTAPTSTTATMMGLGAQATPAVFTPRLTGRILIVITGVSANSVAASGATAQISYGTGTAPANAAAKTGTQVGTNASMTSATAAALVPFSLVAIVTGLTLGTAYWLDLAAAQLVGAAVTLSALSITVIEV